MSVRRWLIVALSFGVAISVSAYIVRSGWAREGAPPLLPWWAHVLALGAVCTEILTRGLKIHWSAAALRIPLRLETAVRTILGGDFAAAITPGRSGAEPARFLVLAEAGVPAAGIVLVLFTEIFLELISLIVVVVGLSIVFRESGSVLVLMLGVIGVYAAFLVAVGVFGYFLAHRNANGPPPRWARRFGLHAGRWRRIQRLLRSLRSGIAALRHARLAPMIAATAASAVHVLLRLLMLVIIVRSVEPATSAAPLLLWSLVLLYGSTLAPAPGGGGAVEYSFKLALGGLLAADVLGGSLIWWRFYTFYLYILLGALAAGSTVLRALRERPDEIIAEART
jgi:glycosyltransferase 2 family protein